MKNLLLPLLALAACIFSAGCPNPKPILPPVSFSLNSPFALQVGQSGEWQKMRGFTIKFDKIAADSRCPLGVQCVTAGRAEVVLTLTKSGESHTVTLPFTTTEAPESAADFQGHTVRVMGVSPFRTKDKDIKTNEYSVTLSVAEIPNSPANGE